MLRNHIEAPIIRPRDPVSRSAQSAHYTHPQHMEHGEHARTADYAANVTISTPDHKAYTVPDNTLQLLLAVITKMEGALGEIQK